MESSDPTRLILKIPRRCPMIELVTGLIIGLFCGGTLGVLLMACVIAAARADDEMLGGYR